MIRKEERELQEKEKEGRVMICEGKEKEGRDRSEGSEE